MAHEGQGLRDLVLGRVDGPSPEVAKDRSFEDQVMALERFKEALFEDEGISKAVRALETFVRVTMKKVEADSQA